MVKPTERRVGYGVALGYGITDLFGGGAFAIIGTWLLFFYTTYCGLTVLEAGSIFAVARIIDALLSPIMGYITDNFGNTWLGRKFGRRRFFLLISSPLMFLYALLWLTDMGYWYYLGTYLSIELLSAMVLVPWETLAAEMTNRYEERSRLSGVRMICSQLGGFLAVSVPGVIMQFTGKDNPFTYTLTGLLFSCVFCIAVFITWRCTWEAKDVHQESDFKVDNKRNGGILNHLKYLVLDLFSSFRIRAFRLHYYLYLLVYGDGCFRLGLYLLRCLLSEPGCRSRFWLAEYCSLCVGARNLRIYAVVKPFKYHSVRRAASLLRVYFLCACLPVQHLYHPDAGARDIVLCSLHFAWGGSLWPVLHSLEYLQFYS
jgi:Na+/melibiose symporter-like transporter